MNPDRSTGSIPSTRTFGLDESALDSNDASPGAAGSREPAPKLKGFSFRSQQRPSFVGRWGRQDEEGGLDPTAPIERPPIPSALQAPGEAYSTPLPVLSMIVLSITMLGEFLSANVSTPFLLFMVKGFGELTDDADVAFWTGILVAAFFLTQFVTSLLWATVAEKHGQRAVLAISLLGSAITCLIFGTSTSLEQAIAVRLAQGIFAGAVGVARGSVTLVTDPSNEGRAYAILGFCWGLGGVVGAVIGGSFERPADKWPGVFGQIPIFVKFPYLLPCALAACITFTGSVLSLFLGRDAGPREGAIKLLPEKIHAQIPSTIPEGDEESAPPSPTTVGEDPVKRSIVGELRKQVSKKLSGYFPSRVSDGQIHPGSPASPPDQTAPNKMRTFSRTSRATGSAYGYTAGFRSRLASNATVGPRRNSMTSSMRRRGRRESNQDGIPGSVEGGDLNFAQRLLMANENAVTNIADLWVAAAMNVDNEDPFLSDTDIDSDALTLESPAQTPDHESEDFLGAPSTSTADVRGRSGSAETVTPSSVLKNKRPSNTGFRPRFDSPHRFPTPQPGPSSPPQRSSFSHHIEHSPAARRFSHNVTIFSHPGVKTPPAVTDAQQLLLRSEEPIIPPPDGLMPIIEHQQTSTAVEAISEKAPSLSSQLPILIIIQYGVLALHTTTHDQIFMSYLVSDYEAGGLNLNAGDFAQLIAMMCLVQIAYQFYLYPNMGPPRGRFSHLAMFRLGSVLFIPSYLSVILYRVFASSAEGENFLLMSALALSTAVRYCAITFGYTSISILLNYMTPPNAVGFANGIAQSIVSLARCFGPVLGGYLWSVSVQDNPSGYPFGFIVCAGACALAVASSFIIR